MAADSRTVIFWNRLTLFCLERESDLALSSAGSFAYLRPTHRAQSPSLSQEPEVDPEKL